MDIQRIAAFSHDGKGGSPAGVVLLDAAVPDADMARVAAEVGYSETVFAFQNGDSTSAWRARYFSPETEGLSVGTRPSLSAPCWANSMGLEPTI